MDDNGDLKRLKKIQCEPLVKEPTLTKTVAATNDFADFGKSRINGLSKNHLQFIRLSFVMVLQLVLIFLGFQGIFK